MSETSTERNRRIFEEATSAGEPVFVIRAKDQLGIDAIWRYRDLAQELGVTDDFDHALNEAIGDFREWRLTNPDKLKAPDVR